MIEYDIAVIGAGSSGCEAACGAAETGVKTILIDQHDIPIERFPDASALTLRPNSLVWGLFPGFQIALAGGSERVVTAKRVVLATGAIDMAHAFPGSDLPGVMTGRGLRRLLECHHVWPGGKRVAVVGIWPHTFELAATIRAFGGQVVVEEVTLESPIEAIATDGVVSGIRIGCRSYKADIIAVELGLQPDLALAAMMECEIGFSRLLGGCVPVRNDRLETSVAGLYVCGALAGIGSPEAYEQEGRLAGCAAAHSLGCYSDDDLEDAMLAFEVAFPDRTDAAAAIALSWAQYDVSRSIATPAGEFWDDR